MPDTAISIWEGDVEIEKGRIKKKIMFERQSTRFFILLPLFVSVLDTYGVLFLARPIPRKWQNYISFDLHYLRSSEN